ncbi:MAG TPA: MarR family transcriptional regulator [Alphaproteobacteria bacterium]|nr:MarR family transcriptional regulator [Alphaproteobacteria bacterium]
MATPRPRARPDPGAPWSEEQIREGIELLFFAYRDFTSDPDRILAPLGMGRAHHRVVHFVGRTPDMTVGELLAILKITKQSLARVLGQLVREGYIVQRPGATDRRERRLHLTPSGQALERRLSEPQRQRVGAAYRAAGPAAVEAFRRVLTALRTPEPAPGTPANKANVRQSPRRTPGGRLSGKS